MPLWQILAALAVPLAIWYIWYRSERVVYKGEATIFPLEEGVKPVRSNRIYTTVLVPDYALIAVDVPLIKAQALKRPREVEVEVRKRFLGNPYVETIVWERGAKPEAAEQHSAGIVLAGYYLLAGIFFLSMSLPAAAAAFVLSGYLTGGVAHAQLKMSNMSGGQQVLLWFWLAVSGLGTVMLFRELSFLTFFPGALLSFSFGQILGMLSLAWGQSETEAQQ